MRLHRPKAFIGMAIVAGALLLPTAPAGAAPARVGPSVVTGYLEGPVELTWSGDESSPEGPLAPIASLAVGKGEWVAVATFDITGDYVTTYHPTCRLKAGADQDRIDLYPNDVYPSSSPYYDGTHADEHLSLVVAHHFGSGGGHIVLSCGGSGYGGEAHPKLVSAIRIVAVKTARLRTVNLADGSHTVSGDTSGSAASTIFHGRRTGPVKISGDGATSTKVAEMQLGTGSWWVHATALLSSRTEVQRATVTCQLSRSSTPTGSGDADSASSGMYYANESGGRPQVTLDAAMTFTGSGGRALVLCSTPAEWDADARSIRITAVRASRLQRLLLPSGQDVTTGMAHPYVVAARRPGEQTPLTTSYKTMAVMHLKYGRWLVNGKVDVHSDVGELGRFQVRCRLITGPYTDGGTVGSEYGSATLPLQFVVTVFSDEGGTVKLQCRKVVNAPASGVIIKRIRLTALQLGTYERKPIEP